MSQYVVVSHNHDTVLCLACLQTCCWVLVTLIKPVTTHRKHTGIHTNLFHYLGFSIYFVGKRSVDREVQRHQFAAMGRVLCASVWDARDKFCTEWKQSIFGMEQGTKHGISNATLSHAAKDNTQHCGKWCKDGQIRRAHRQSVPNGLTMNS